MCWEINRSSLFKNSPGATKGEIHLATLNFRAMPQYLKDLIQFVVKQEHPRKGAGEGTSISSENHLSY